MKAAIKKLKDAEDIDEPARDDLHLDQDIQGTTGSPDLVPTIFGKIEKSEVVVADVTIVGKTNEAKCLINSNVAIELGYALRACTVGAAPIGALFGGYLRRCKNPWIVCQISLPEETIHGA